MTMGNNEETKPYRKHQESTDWKSILGSVATVAAPVALGIAGWAHGILWGHDTRLTTLEVQRQAAASEYQQHQDRDAKVQDQIQATLRRLEDKIDALRDRGQK